MVKPKNPFIKWIAIEKSCKIKFYLCTSTNQKIHAATYIDKDETNKKYLIKRRLFEEYPMLLEYMGEPSLYSIASIQQWLQNIIDIEPEAFDIKVQTEQKLEDKIQEHPWCYMLFCRNKQRQEIPIQVYASNNLETGQTIMLCHGIKQWKIIIKDECFQDGWEKFCIDNLIGLNDLIMLRNKGNYTFDTMAFSKPQSLIVMPWTLPLPMISERHPIVEGMRIQDNHPLNVSSSINQYFKHDCGLFVSFYTRFTSSSKYKMKIPKYINPLMEECKTPTIVLTSGNKTYSIGMKRRSFEQNWDKFVLDHDLQEEELLVFIPQPHNFFAVLIFTTEGVERLYPWHYKFIL